MTPTDLFEALPDMAVFARVVDAGNFSEAARQLGSMPSTVSRQIKRLEQALGTQLVERSTRRIRVTESGAEVYRHCRDMLDAAACAVDAAGRLAARPHGRVIVSAPTAFARTVLHPLIPDFLRRYAEVDVQLVFNDHDVDPLVEDIDLVIRLTERPPLGLAGRTLGAVRWVLCASQGYLDSRGVPLAPAELLDHDCLYLGETTDDNRWRLRREGQTEVVPVKGRYIANHAGARLDAARQGFGIANLPEFVAREALQNGEVVQVLADWELDGGAYIGSVWLLYPPKRFLPPKIRVLIDYLIERLAQ
ncbi:LysR family transcriptional regulator [Pseudomonas eucalypticola]|uniref:LysR family transcriptional regulator n=1 Tax=Pseudomonas eucalypticola TaxID=2599595 RepID=A0A7D5H180_9PSED|nr:LysR family transcriptional regulator [Pseudomonas eucalypticola]QKZ02922.1 LysR family transcriptional regulator [Pseudomonas eucalypticola]